MTYLPLPMILLQKCISKQENGYVDDQELIQVLPAYIERIIFI